jgi:hypothetical protein
VTVSFSPFFTRNTFYWSTPIRCLILDSFLYKLSFLVSSLGQSRISNVCLSKCSLTLIYGVCFAALRKVLSLYGPVTSPEGSTRLRHPYFRDSQYMKVVSLYPFLLATESTQGHSVAGRFMWMKNSLDNIRNRTRVLPACSALLQPTAPRRVPQNYVPCAVFLEISPVIS